MLVIYQLPPLFYNLVPAFRDSASVHLLEAAEQSRVELDLSIRLGDTELRAVGIEFELDGLQNDWVVSVPIGAPPHEVAVSENELESL